MKNGHHHRGALHSICWFLTYSQKGAGEVPVSHDAAVCTSYFSFHRGTQRDFMSNLTVLEDTVEGTVTPSYVSK